MRNIKGSIVLTAERENAVIDGQQRLSSLTLLQSAAYARKKLQSDRATGYIEEQTGVASNYCNYMNTQIMKSSISSRTITIGLPVNTLIR